MPQRHRERDKKRYLRKPLFSFRSVSLCLCGHFFYPEVCRADLGLMVVWRPHFKPSVVESPICLENLSRMRGRSIEGPIRMISCAHSKGRIGTSDEPGNPSECRSWPNS